MQAVVLAGGLGTRLRPITYTRPKPLLPIVNRPLVLRVLDILPPVVDEVFIATGYMGDRLSDFFKDRRTGPKVEVVVEDRPLGTGGALKNLEDRIRGTFIVVNGDVICSLDIGRMLAFHGKMGALGTISLWEVEDPTPYGMVVTDERGRICRFKEKPRRDEVVSRAVNAGTYILEPELLGCMRPGSETSIEKEVFPNVLERGLFGFGFKGYWYDAGTLASYLEIHSALMRLEGGAVKGAGLREEGSAAWHPPFETGRDCKIGDGTTMGPGVCIGDGVRIGKGASLSDCVVHDGVAVGDRAVLDGCIIGENAVIRDGTRVPPGTIIGDRAVVE